MLEQRTSRVLAPDGRVVVYMGDDERGEFLYRYVSTHLYVAGGDTGHLLDDGQLYVARFDDDMSGEWIALTPESTGMEAAEILIHARMAASAIGVTTMDRPEWVAVNPIAVQAYRALTNNTERGVAPNAGGDPMPVGDPATGEIARFLTGPKGCEVTGLTWSSDRRTAFVGIQHPGGTWPDGIDNMPRSALIAVKRDDNGVLG